MRRRPALILSALPFAILLSWLVPSVAQADVVVSLSTSSLAFPDTYYGTESAPLTVTVTSVGTDPLTISAAQIAAPDDGSFSTTGGTCFGNPELATGQSCTVLVAATPQDAGDLSADLEILDNSPHDPEIVHLSVHAPDPTQGLYYPTTATRLLDTRIGLGATKRPVKAGGVLALAVRGHGGLPASGISAVVLNLTVTRATSAGYVSAYPGGTTRPTVSNVNFAAGWTGANLVTVPVGANGAVNLYSSAASVDLIADVVGWYASSQSIDSSYGVGGAFLPSDSPVRIMDTRTDNGGHHPLAGHHGVEVAVAYDPSIPVDQIHAVDISLTSTAAQGGGYLTASSLENDPTLTSTLNLRVGVTTSNMALVPLEPCTETWCTDPDASVVVFGVYNGSSAATDVLIDVSGSYVNDTISPLRFHTLAPTRIVDTRIHEGTTPLGAKAAHNILAPSSVAGDDTVALAANVTAVHPTASTYLTVWPTGTQPTTSIMNPKKGVVLAVGSTIGLTDYLRFFVYNNSGTTNLLVDVSGAFDLYPSSSPLARSLDRGQAKAQPDGLAPRTQLRPSGGPAGPEWH